MIRYSDVQPVGAFQVTTGYLRAQDVTPPVLARELLKISQSEYVVRTISEQLVLYRISHPEMAGRLEDANYVYTLGDAYQDETNSRIVLVPFTLYAVNV